MEYTIEQVRTDKKLQDKLCNGRVTQIICYDSLCFLLTEKTIIIKTNIQTIQCMARPARQNPNKMKFKTIYKEVEAGNCKTISDFLSQVNEQIETHSIKLDWLL